LGVKGRIIAVTSDGLDVTSKENADMISRILSNRGLVVTGHKDNSMNLASCMLVQIALANKVVVVSCVKESRTMQAVEFARKIGKPIFAVDNGRSGNRYFIDNGIATNV
jgi:predicted Rossmann fold nucleotide-binding protein DprA/Smf involved in DNA uptake